jgi:hypothetical protein
MEMRWAEIDPEQLIPMTTYLGSRFEPTKKTSPPIAAAKSDESNSVDSGQKSRAKRAQNFAMQLSERQVRRAAAFRLQAMTE